MDTEDTSKLPTHIAIIMDGNGRWAQARGQERREGHRAGVEALRRIVKDCSDLGVHHLTVFSFSTENWGRPRNEVSFLMSLLSVTLKAIWPICMPRACACGSSGGATACLIKYVE